MYTYDPSKTGVDTTQLITDISTTIAFWTEYIHNEYFERNCKVMPVHILEFLLHMAKCPSRGAKTTLKRMYNDHETKYNRDISKMRVVASTMNEARDKIKINIWHLIFDDISQLIQSQIKGRRYFAIDGSSMKTQHSQDFVDAYGYKSKSYLPHAFTSLLYDIDYGFPIHAIISESTDERLAAMQHMSYIKKGDVVVMDRGYYSKLLFKAFTDKGIHVVFRMKSDTSKGDWASSEVDILGSKDGFDCRFVKYTVDDTNYMMLTSLMDKSMDCHEFIKTLYHKRWNVETAFRYIKERFSFANFHARTVGHLIEEFYAGYILFMMSRILEYHTLNCSTYDVYGDVFRRNVIINNYTCGKHDLRINFKECLDFVDGIVTSINYDIQLQMDNLTKIIIQDLVPIVEDRKFVRSSRQAQNQWTKTNRDKLIKYDTPTTTIDNHISEIVDTTPVMPCSTLVTSVT